MSRWLVVLIALAGCGSKSKSVPHAGAEILGCDATHRPTAEAAYAQYLAEGGEPNRAAPRLVEVDNSKKHPDVYWISMNPGPEQPSLQFGTVFRCRLYREDNKLATAIVLDGGWATAAPDKRVQLALDADAIAFGDPVRTKLAGWDDAHPFLAPTATAQPDGGVKILEWRYRPEVISYSTGEDKQIYVRDEVAFAKDGTVPGPKEIESWEVPSRKDRNGPPANDAPPTPIVPRVAIAGCDATHPPERKAVYDLFVKGGGKPAELSTILFVHPKADPDLWQLLYMCCSESDPVQLARVWKCGLFVDDRAFAQAIVLDRGWATATPDQRKELARAADAMAFGAVTDPKPEKWDGDNTYEAPVATVLPDGGVLLVAWRFRESGAARWGGPDQAYVRERVRFGADGTAYGPTILETFAVKVDAKPAFTGSAGSGTAAPPK